MRFKEELECNTNTGFQGYYFTSTDVGFDVTGGIEPYSYSWDFGDDANPSSSSIGIWTSYICINRRKNSNT